MICKKLKATNYLFFYYISLFLIPNNCFRCMPVRGCLFVSFNIDPLFFISLMFFIIISQRNESSFRGHDEIQFTYFTYFYTHSSASL